MNHKCTFDPKSFLTYMRSHTNSYYALSQLVIKNQKELRLNIIETQDTAFFMQLISPLSTEANGGTIKTIGQLSIIFHKKSSILLPYIKEYTRTHRAFLFMYCQDEKRMTQSILHELEMWIASGCYIFNNTFPECYFGEWRVRILK